MPCADRFAASILLIALAALAGCQSDRGREPTAQAHDARPAGEAGSSLTVPSTQPATTRQPEGISQIGQPVREPGLAPPPLVQSRESKINVPPRQFPVKEGPLPLVYMVETAGVVEVIDVNTGAVVAQRQLPPRAIVSVDAQHGVRANGEAFSTVPLTPGHAYQIFVHSPEDYLGQGNRYRTTVVQPGK